MEPDKKSKFLRSCSAVFQGGGCRVAAFAGAYRVASERGLQFTEVAGTSGGAIMAAMIGAGATPEFILSCFKDLDFTKFLRPPVESETDGPSVRWTPLLRLLQPFNPKVVKAVLSILSRGGMYSSSYIQEWMQEQLKKLLPQVHGDVRFADLPIPTYIVATDLQGCKPKIWSSYHSRDEYVALAVRASCSIPFFFQPVRFGDNRFVDGGVLSNLPTFVFTSEEPLSNAVLAFQLKGDYVPVKNWSALGTSRRLIDAVVDGATELQQQLQPYVRAIVIPTGNIEATDFEKMDIQTISQLIAAGVQATESFIDQEHVRAGSPPSHILCRSRDEAYAAITSRADSVFKEVVISQRDAYFIWKLFPTILFWRGKGIEIRILLEPIRGLDENQRAYEMARRSLLTNLGATIVEAEVLPEIGYVFDGTDDNRSGAVLYSTRESEHLPFATCYFGPEHQNVVRPVFKDLSHFFENSETENFIPDMTHYDQEILVRTLKEREAFYKNDDDVTLCLESVPVSSLHLTSRYLRDFKFKQIDMLVRMYQRKELELFASAATSLKDGTLSVITPPVIEERGSRKVVIEGNTRSLFCYLNGLESMDCIVVRNVRDDLPADPIEIKYGRVVSKELKPEERMRNYRRGLLRRIENAMHPVVN